MRNVVKIIVDFVISSGVTFTAKTILNKLLPAVETLTKEDRIKIAIGVFGIVGATSYTVNCWINSTIDDVANLINDLQKMSITWKEAKTNNDDLDDAVKEFDAKCSGK